MSDEFVDPLNDPRFPDRPNTPDFWRLSEVSLAHDAASEDQSIGDIIADLVDEPSLMYLASQRMGNAFNITPAAVGPELWVIFMGLYLDAFCKGVSFEKAGGHRPNETGTAGEGGSK